MVDPKSRVAAVGIPPIVPESVETLARVQAAYRIGPALVDQAAIGVPALRPKQRIIDPTFGSIHIEIGRHHVKVASEYDRSAARQQLFRMDRKPLKPSQLIVELRPRRGGAVGQI